MGGTKIFCLRQNILSMAKGFVSAVHGSLKMNSFVQKLTVSSRRVIFLDLYVAEMSFLSTVSDKTCFVWADGMGKIDNFCPWHLHGQNILCPRQNQFCPRQKNRVPDKKLFVLDKIFCPQLKSSF